MENALLRTHANVLEEEREAIAKQIVDAEDMEHAIKIKHVNVIKDSSLILLRKNVNSLVMVSTVINAMVLIQLLAQVVFLEPATTEFAFVGQDSAEAIAQLRLQ